MDLAARVRPAEDHALAATWGRERLSQQDVSPRASGVPVLFA